MSLLYTDLGRPRGATRLKRALVLTRFNFNTSMDKKSHTQESQGWNWTVQPLKFGNSWIISSEYLLLVHTEIKVKSC